MAYGNPCRLYAIELASGVIKIGITSLGEQRATQHARNHALRRQFFSAGYVSGVAAEAELIARVARIGTLCHGREWFTGISFSQAAQLVRQVARQFVEANPVSKAHLLRLHRANLSFNDHEIAILDAYCNRFGKSRADACRELFLSSKVVLEHAANCSAGH